MNSICPTCQKQLNLDIQQIIDEQIVTCPHCQKQFQVQLSPQTKLAFESTNQEIESYMIAYPHRDRISNNLPSGVQHTIE